MRKQTKTELLKQKGFRATKPRLMILSALMKSHSPMSVEEVAKSIRQNRTDIVTVYRTLEAFEKAGIARLVDLRRGKSYFELKNPKDDHHHVVCTECGDVRDFTGCDYPTLTKRAIKQTAGFAKITSHSLELFGVCTPCTRV